MRRRPINGPYVDRFLDTFTLKAVGQDDFSDVAVPDAPVQPATPPNASVNQSAGGAQ
jgi:cytochrome c oxidase assembly factor 3